MAFRTSIPDFAIANPIYAGARVIFREADVNGLATATIATLFREPTGAQTVQNPVTLDAFGKFAAPVYVERPVVAEIVSATTGSHSTGVIAARGRWRGDWITNTRYFVDDLIQDPILKNVYLAADDFLSGASISADVSGGKLQLKLDVAAIAQGPPGAAGATIHDGTTDPGAGLGNNGDLYFQMGSGATGILGDVWKKTAGAWSIITNIRGAAGDGTGDLVGPDGGVANNEVMVFNGVTGKLAKGAGGSLASLTQARTTMDRIVISGTTLTINANDHAGKLLVFTNALICTVTIPAGLPTNMVFQCRAKGAGGVGFVASGTTLDAEGLTLQRYKGCTWVHAGSNEWEGTGGLA